MTGRLSGTGPTDRDDPTGPDTAQLVRRAADGDQLAWNELVERHSALLWSVCRAHRLGTADAADVFQQTWLRLLENLDSIHDPNRLPGWLATTCRRECLAVLRRGKRLMPTGDDGWLDHLAGPTTGADGAALVADRNAALWRAFGQLGRRCQEILRVLVVAADADRPPYEVAAAALGMPIGSLGPTRARCLAQLRKSLDAGGITDPGTDS